MPHALEQGDQSDHSVVAHVSSGILALGDAIFDSQYLDRYMVSTYNILPVGGRGVVECSARAWRGRAGGHRGGAELALVQLQVATLGLGLDT